MIKWNTRNLAKLDLLQNHYRLIYKILFKYALLLVYFKQHYKIIIHVWKQGGTWRSSFSEHFKRSNLIFGSLFLKIWIFPICFIFCHFLYFNKTLNKLIYLDRWVIPKDRYYFSEHFGISFVIVGSIFKKLWILQNQYIFCPFTKVQGKVISSV